MRIPNRQERKQDFLSCHFAALSCREKARKTSGTSVDVCMHGKKKIIDYYPHRIHLQGPFKVPPLTPAMEDFNRAMSSVRSSVEWVFGDVIGSFKFLDFKKNLKIGLSPVGKHYIVSALLRNALTCLYGNNIGAYFGVEPPSLEEYFS